VAREILFELLKTDASMRLDGYNTAVNLEAIPVEQEPNVFFGASVGYVDSCLIGFQLGVHLVERCLLS
jgi:hypothetical protein